jgi:hypothetical protein
VKTLWFKQVFVADILRGVKTDTIRRESNRLPAIGDTIGLSVGARAPFAVARIVRRRRVRLDRLSDKRRAQLGLCYADPAERMIRLTFEVLARSS